jgi:hypothetical protein
VFGVAHQFQRGQDVADVVGHGKRLSAVRTTRRTGTMSANQMSNNIPNAASQTAANDAKGFMAPTVRPVPLRYSARKPPSASLRIARTEAWAGCSERYVRSTVRLHAERVAAAIEVYREAGDISRASYLLAVVSAAAAPTSHDTAPLSDLLHEVQLVDASEERPDEVFRHRLQAGTATVEDGEAAMRFYQEQATASECGVRAVRQWVLRQRGSVA